MKKRNQLLIFIFCYVSIIFSQTSKQFRPAEIWKDNNGKHINAHAGGILYHNGKYYWFGENKIEGEAGNYAQIGVQCYSSKDLYNWTNEGTVLKISEDPKSLIAKGCVIERPKVIYNRKTKTFVMWFHQELKGKGYKTALAGLAISSKITGPYQYIHSIRANIGQWPLNVLPIHQRAVPTTTLSNYCGSAQCLPAHPDTLNLLGRDFLKGQMVRDMNLFVDDDLTAYLIYTSEENSTLHVAKLSSDYRSFSGEYVRLFVNRFMEAPTIFKKNGKYYLIASGCSGWAPNAARSAFADQIFGDWKELGNPCIGNDSALTFHSQSTFVLPVQGKKDNYIFMADRWVPDNAIDGRYIWLPIEWDKEKPIIKWLDNWNLNSTIKK